MVTRKRQVNRGQSSNQEVEELLRNKSIKRSTKRQTFTKKFLSISSILGALCFVYFVLGLHTKSAALGSHALDKLVVKLNYHNPFYAVIIDAGSTGSRVLAYTFHKSVISNEIILDDELWYEIKPGLSTFSENLGDVKNYLNKLLNKARTVVPENERKNTPLSMKATAGLRLLPGHKAESLLEECRKVFESSGFLVSEDSVSIMTGTDEGIFSWFTVNYLLGTFSRPSDSFETSNRVALDLGGGSTQVTFAVPKKNLEDTQEWIDYEKNIHNIKVFNDNVTAFTDSILGLGLMAARKAILTHPDNYLNTPKDQIPVKDNEVRSICINPIISGVEWSFSGDKYIVMGPVNGTRKKVKSSINNQKSNAIDEPIVDFPSCFSLIKKVVLSRMTNKIPSFKGLEIYTFSYYFDRATEAGLIDPFKGGVIELKQLHKAAKETCDYANTDQPFMCLDLTFIYVLLHDGFGLDDKVKLNMRKKINNHEISWTLGVAFSVLEN